jgi:hypothetical protein
VKALATLALLTAGCAVRTGTADYYLGPMLHRTAARCGETQVSQVLHIGALAEIGRQTGVAFGVVERVAVTPAQAEERECGNADATAPGGTVPRAQTDRWSFSPFFLRVPRRGEPRLVRRGITGAQLAVGPESTAVSLGGVFTTFVYPPDDAFGSVRFDAARPMETRLMVWTVRDDAPVPESSILEETQR